MYPDYIRYAGMMLDPLVNEEDVYPSDIPEDLRLRLKAVDELTNKCNDRLRSIAVIAMIVEQWQREQQTKLKLKKESKKGKKT